MPIHTTRRSKRDAVEFYRGPRVSTRFAYAQKRLSVKGLSVCKDDSVIWLDVHVRGYEDALPYDVFWLNEIQERFGVRETDRVIEELIAVSEGVFFLLP